MKRIRWGLHAVCAVALVMFAVAFLPSSAWADTSTVTTAPTATETTTATATVTTTATATATATATVTAAPVTMTLDSDQFGVFALCGALLVCTAGFAALAGVRLR